MGAGRWIERGVQDGDVGRRGPRETEAVLVCGVDDTPRLTTAHMVQRVPQCQRARHRPSRHAARPGEWIGAAHVEPAETPFSMSPAEEARTFFFPTHADDMKVRAGELMEALR